MRLELSKRTKGRHRRRPARPSEPRVPIPVLAIVAAVTLSLIALSGGTGPAADPRSVPGAVPTDGSGPDERASNSEILKRFLDPALLEAVPVGPEPVAEPVKVVLTSARVITSLGESGIPDVALRAYKRAESRLGDRRPSCHLSWTLVAAIGRVESNHGRFGGAQLRSDGSGTSPIRGIPLDGRPHVALIRDTDGGALDGDRYFDRAVGPMQFIPSTWRAFAVDGNGDGRRDPNNIYDAAQGAGAYLCAGGGDLRDPAQAARAIRRYNNADTYVRVVLSLAQQYLSGNVTILPSSGDSARSDQPEPTTTARPPATSRPPAPAPSPTAPAPRPSTPTARPTAPAPTATPTAPAPTSSAPAPNQTATTAPSLPPSESATPTESAPPPSGTSNPGPSGQPSDSSVEPPETAAVGWAPAMREVVLSLLATPSTTPTSTAPTSATPTSATPTSATPRSATPRGATPTPDAPQAGTTSAPLGDSPGDHPTVVADPAREGWAAR